MSSVFACGDDSGGEGPSDPDGSMTPPEGEVDMDGSAGPQLDAIAPPVDRDDAGQAAPDADVVPQGPDGSMSSPDGSTSDCASDCDDGIDCTVDTCVGTTCQHRIDDSVCAAGSSCKLGAGCTQGVACATDADCADGDGCTSNERCNVMLGRCEWDVLDQDGDGYPPASCGGTDCDDSRGLVSPTAEETCDGEDDDCDGVVDDNLTPVAGFVCEMGDPVCAAGFAACGLRCVDLQTDARNCGECGNDCGSGGVCSNGVCGACPVGGSVMSCGDTCADLNVDALHCGACGAFCAPVAQGQAQVCVTGSCEACGGEGQPCCGDLRGLEAWNGCLVPGLRCSGPQYAPGSVCQCGEGMSKCGDACVDLKADEDHCGACGTACGQGEACITRGETTACEPCGGIGQTCCDGSCARAGFGAACSQDNTCVRVEVPSNGAGAAAL